jgi:hypothetical protein
MKKSGLLLIVIIAVFLIVMVIYAAKPASANLPYSSESTAANGTKAAFLLLDDLGFQVERKKGADIKEDGLIIALGAEYLPQTEESQERLEIADSHRYTNGYISYYAHDFVEIMWPYKDTVIYFDEYKRRATPHLEQAVAEGDLLSVMPLWLKIALLNVMIILFFGMFFFNQRVGEAQVPQEFSARNPLEGVYAMAGAMCKAKVFKDCARLYYNYRAGKTAPWDAANRLGSAVMLLDNEKEAVRLLRDIDNCIKEWKNENK